MLIRNGRYSLMAMLVLAIMTLSSLNPALALADAQGAEPLTPQEGETPRIYLPLVRRSGYWPIPAEGQEIANADFEAGTMGWEFYVDVGNPILSTAQAHSPQHSAELGQSFNLTDPQAYIRRAYVQQWIWVPAGRTYLHYWELVTTDEDPLDPPPNPPVCSTFLGDHVKIRVLNFGVTVKDTSLCAHKDGENIVPGVWTEGSVDLSTWADHWVQLRIEYTSDATMPSDYYLDDLSLTAAP